MDNSLKNSDKNQILEYLRNLEKRISKIETQLNIGSPIKSPEPADLDQLFSNRTTISSDALEFQIGQYWFAKAGIVALAIGVVFLLTLQYQNLPSVLPSFLGYIIVVIIWALSHYLRKSFSLISRYLFGGGLLLLYFATLRLHFFTEQPAIQNRNILIWILLVISIINLLIAMRRKSVYLSGYSITLAYFTAALVDQPVFLFTLVVLFCTFVVYLKFKFNWTGLLNYAIGITYFIHLIWFINNPFLGNKLQLATTPEINLIFLLIYATIFVLGNLFRTDNQSEDSNVIINTFLNCAGCYGLFLLITITTFKAHIGLYHFIASFMFLGFSIFFWIREKSKYQTFFYAILGYTALSVAIITQFPIPDFFIWLSWQTLIVVTTAILFRSKFIVLANFIIFIIIFGSYLFLAGKADIISLSFGVVALLSARVMNWQKDRLELKTEYMRDAYLISAFFIGPYALYHAVPNEYVSLAWVGVAIFYYIMSVVINNKKYRWMALFTLLLTVIYIFIIGTIKLEPLYRIISFLVLGSVLIIISLFYTRMRLKLSQEE